MIDANITLVLMIAQAISQTPYDYDAYTCWDYSTDLQSALRNVNITSHIVDGWMGHNYHSWIEFDGVWIEPQEARVVSPADGYKKTGYISPKFNPLKKSYLEGLN